MDRDEQPGTSSARNHEQFDEAEKLHEARDRAHKVILEAEQYKVTVEQPKGKMNEGITDDEFFHLTCHLDPALKLKIEKGEFIVRETFAKGSHGEK